MSDTEALRSGEERFVLENWSPMSTFPKDGTRCAVLFKYGAVSDQPLWWGRAPMGDRMTIVGSQNALSPYLVPLGWKKFEDAK